MHLPISCWVVYKCTCPPHAECSAVSDPNVMTPMAHSLYSPNLTLSDFYFVSPDEKLLKGKCFADVEEVKQKTAEALKGIKINEL